jgi:hypothetical protein
MCFALQAMDVASFWQLQRAAVEAANARSPMNKDGQHTIELGDLWCVATLGMWHGRAPEEYQTVIAAEDPLGSVQISIQHGMQDSRQ